MDEITFEGNKVIVRRVTRRKAQDGSDLELTDTQISEFLVDTYLASKKAERINSKKRYEDIAKEGVTKLASLDDIIEKVELYKSTI